MAAWYQRREKPSHTVKRLALKLKAIRISSGAWRNASAKAA